MKKDTGKDVIIIGGGLAGLSLACLLGTAGVHTLCIDRVAPRKDGGTDLRTTAISYGSRKILDKAGIWQNLDGPACPIEDIRILDGESPLLLNFLSEEVGGRTFGWIVENADLKNALYNTVKSLKCVTLKAPAQVRDFKAGANFVSVLLEDGEVLKAPLVVGADGRKSFTREWMGVRTRGWRYNQRAVICTVSHQNPHYNKAIEHFFPAGPFAVLPMADDKKGRHRSSVVFTEHGPEKNSLMRLDDKTFEMALAARFPEDYGAIKLIGSRAAYPLGLVHAAEYIAPRMALVADAAHGIHPIAGQGLNLGFRDVEELAGLVSKAVSNGKDPGSEELLLTYQRRRRPDNMAMVAVTDGLNRLFSNNFLPVRLLRRAGLRAVSKLPPVKRFFMRRAMGKY